MVLDSDGSGKVPPPLKNVSSHSPSCDLTRCFQVIVSTWLEDTRVESVGIGIDCASELRFWEHDPRRLPIFAPLPRCPSFTEHDSVASGPCRNPKNIARTSS
ncbi:hypothetical protein A4X13_0g5551 [Tilletia indica]|uniref:Uncharacterized protein n=1 Tax=Tilletia indica TaxID=43049 RepID=A0A177TLR0_9BASI|nr:hypothetical protein A4X13_0g5551 [Tilletia indica]